MCPKLFRGILIFIDKIFKTHFLYEEKFANFTPLDFSSSKVIMLHGSSVGEIQSLEHLIKQIKNDFANTKIVLTTSTPTGQELAKKKYSQLADFITFFPYDIYKVAQDFLNKIKPDVILIAETELWPNFFICAHDNKIPLYIINARLSDKSFPNYLKIKNFIKIILNSTAGIFCQSELDKSRYIELGAEKNKVEVMKNLKFKIEKKPCDIDLKTQGFKTIIAASTHSGEEEIIVRVYKKLKEKIKNLKLIIAPRHLNRLDEVKKTLVGVNFGFRTREDNFLSKDVIVLDTLGELSKVYAIVDVAFIGGSFNKTGGHNPLEATVYSKPTISGSSIKNFRDIYAILTRENSAFIAKSENELLKLFEKLLTDENYYNAISNNCEKCFLSQQGGVEFVTSKLKEILT